jgi:hypothetical protein
MYNLLPWKKAAQKFGLLLQLFKKMPKETIAQCAKILQSGHPDV